MVHTYGITGMTCKGCVAKVKAALESIPNILEAEVDLKFPQARLSMSHHISLEALSKNLKRLGDYEIHEHFEQEETATVSSSKTTYKPLIVTLVFILGVSVLASVSSGKANAMDTMRMFMAGFFITFSFFKFLDLKGFATGYASYDLLAKKWKPYAYIYPFIELALGVSYFLDLYPVETNLITIIVLGFSAIGVIQSVLDKRQIKCACLGTAFNLPMSTVTIVEDLGMVAMGGIMLFLHL